MNKQDIPVAKAKGRRMEIADMVSFAILPCLNKAAMKIIDMPGEERLVSAPFELR